jgi:hypothetical protein
VHKELNSLRATYTKILNASRTFAFNLPDSEDLRSNATRSLFRVNGTKRGEACLDFGLHARISDLALGSAGTGSCRLPLVQGLRDLPIQLRERSLRDETGFLPGVGPLPGLISHHKHPREVDS